MVLMIMYLGDFLILLCFFIAVFVILQLRSALGKRTGHEKPLSGVSPEKRKKSVFSPKGDGWNVVSLNKGKKEDVLDSINGLFPVGTRLNKVFRDIVSIYSGFDPKDFLNGVRDSYGVIVDSFFEGNILKIEKLIDSKVYQDFADSLSIQKSSEKVIKSSLVGLDDLKIVNASVEGNNIYITTRIVGQFISASYDKNNALIAGDPEIFGKVVDVWTFVRNISSSNPNWILISTKPGE
ncbi:hypothetical protein AYO25_02510 [Candidatus Liberibacter solanacearum]|uniref:Tim44-like domain-containing protein n=1 Tax=Candidatus Liberibacter solanacearum TaxID=556287 RepID=A0A1V2N8R5_9HYPH|nr:hypothetical protein AYJ09_01965 [Candidatus Liberibacter solanacearum]ONI59949.1 hypothetical protein AYO25_02510 [Candidatus Liberibacter solanacearum]